MYIHTYTFFLLFFSIMVYLRILNIIPCAIQEDLVATVCIFLKDSIQTMTNPKYRYLERNLLPLEWCLQSHLCYSEWRILWKIWEVIPTMRPGEQAAGFLDMSSLGVPLLMSNLIPLFLNRYKQWTSTTPPPAHHSISPVINLMLQPRLLVLLWLC